VTTFDPTGLVAGGRLGPQVLGHQGPRLVVDDSHIDKEFDHNTGTYICPLDRVFTEPRNPVIVFGTPNVSVILPDGQGGWDRFAAFMAYRKKSFITSTKGRVQAGVFFELFDAPDYAVLALREALETLVGTKKVSCARSVALALHRAGFTAGGKSLARVFRPSRLAAILWRNGLAYQGLHIELRIIQTHQSVSDHFVSVWKREANTAPRLVQKYYADDTHGRAPVFEAAVETLPMSDELWTHDGPRADLGVSIPSDLGVNLGYVFGEQPEFVVRLPEPINDPQLSQTLTPFPGKLDRITKLKKYVLFSWPVVWFMGRNLSVRTEWIKDVPVRALVAMLRRSPSPDRNAAFVYNFTLTATELRLKRLLNDNGRDQKVIAWLLAKHVLQARYKKLCLAGEVWGYGSDDVTIYLSGNSGTYKPDDPRTMAAAELLGEMFQTRVVVVARPEA
jgi:hypothetical protein